MAVEQGDTVSYQLLAGDQVLPLNQLLGKTLKLVAKGEIRCLNCDKKTNKSFQQGYCYRCFTKLAACDRCIMSPELCHYDKGTCREPEWADTHCMTEHIVYLANSSGLKVGITRASQMPTRWIDQGAIQALPILSVANRRLSGLVEVLFKEWTADKTNWRKMLKHEVEALDLLEERDRLLSLADEKLQLLENEYPDQIQRLQSDVWEFEYPHLEWPSKVTSLNFDKQPEISGVLKAIKGQYLILDTGCLNIRKFTSYDVSIELVDAS